MEESESNFCQNENFEYFALNGRFGNSQNSQNSEFFPRELIKVMNDLELETDNHQQTLEALGIIGLLIFAIFYFKFNQRNTMIQKFLAVSWMIIGYKFYLEKGIFKLLNCSKTNLLIGIINLIVGCILYSNFIELFKLKDWKDKKSLMNNFKQIFNFIFLNFSFEIYDVDKITLNNPNTNTNQANSFTFKLILNYTFLILNTFPLLTNFFIKKRLLNFNFSLYPSPLALATFTIFLNYFRNSNYVSSKVFILLDILCYSLLIVNLVNDFVFLKIYSFENFFFILLNVLNLIFIYYFDIYNLNSGNSVESLKNSVEEKAFYGFDRLVIDYLPSGDGGIQGFKEREFFIDNLGTIANSFLVLSSKSLELIQDLTVRPIKLDANLIKYVYPLCSS